MEYVLRWLINPRHSGPVLAMLLAGYYGFVGLFNEDLVSLPDTGRMSGLAFISSASVMLGWWLVRPRDQRFVVPASYEKIYNVVFVLFVSFTLLTSLTAPSIPLLDALRGQDVQEIAVARENFLKAREGIFAVLPYINGLLTFTLVPYAMCLGLVAKVPRRWWMVAFFLGYSLLFVEKAFFIRVFAPLTALLVVANVRKVRLSVVVAVAVAILAVNISISGFADADRDIAEFFIYRLIEVPAQTAVDSIAYWRETWNGNFLYGATNLVFSSLFQLDRIQLERLVFEYQFGAFETGTGSANAVFFIDAYLNFGYVGTVITGMLVGMVLKHVGRSADPAFRCMAPLILFSVFFGSFYSTLFGNGLLLFIMLKPLLGTGRPGAVLAPAASPAPEPPPPCAS